jgi:hypothetical protein
VVTMSVDRKRQALLDALTELGPEWHTRAEIAEQMGKDKLSAAEQVVLDMMAVSGEIERDTRPTAREHISKMIYRIKGGDDTEE